MSYPRIASFKTADALRRHLHGIGVRLELDDVVEAGPSSPLARSFTSGEMDVGNRFCILPMEGWDGTPDGQPSDLTRRRWRHFGQSGAKLIWGGEAVAVRHDGRANPNQLVLSETTRSGIECLRRELVTAHRERFGGDRDLLIGLQLTHSGRYARPSATDRSEARVAYHHPFLDSRFPAGVSMMSDEDLDRLVDDFVAAARLAWASGFSFVDFKHCHGYLGHELLSGRERPGRYGGSFEHRTRFLRNVVAGIRAAVPGLMIGVRLSVFDTVPFKANAEGVGEAETGASGYRWAFGLLDPSRAQRASHTSGAGIPGVPASECGGGPGGAKPPGSDMDAALADARELLSMLEGLNIRWICVTAGSPYYNPHVQRPALFPPSDGYLPPEDPLAGVARHIEATARLKAAFPSMVFVGSGYSYLQEFVPNAAQHTVRSGMADFVGLGRMVLAYPEMPADILAGRALHRKKICRTFSDCTTGPRLGLVSGCYPLDEFYKTHPDAKKLKRLKP
jgi:2,4-dienoyl-CoA reductase-like NADH-dependent reductase (Old Yellow Enzyme family)